ncbi:aminotransferase class III-fold pyridoxal phosphate-dependent enzyme [Novipirellula aureliae]|nr:aminotransferase class III-fold pyridoxal phosphate-dependent enzyme [Novipirellula aureliae]
MQELPKGLHRTLRDGSRITDAVAGRASVLGFGNETISEAIRQTASGYLGDACDLSLLEGVHREIDGEDLRLLESVQSLLETSGESSAFQPESVSLYPSADEGVESMITIARTQSDDSRYRTITLARSDHGRTGMCRSASGRPELQAKFGPMMAGFDHVEPGDVAGLKSVIDESTAAIMLSPIDFTDAAKPIDADYLLEVRQLCDEYDLMLLFDESRLCIGASGWLLTFQSIANIAADAVALSAGLFGGLPGGMLLASPRFTMERLNGVNRYPLQANVAAATLSALNEHLSAVSTKEEAAALAVAIAEKVAPYEFIRDINASGMTIGIETDLPAESLVDAAAKNQLRFVAAGETSVMLQLPLRIEPSERDALLDRLAETMNTMEQSHATSTDSV